MPITEQVAKEQQKRDWLSILGPTVLAIVISLAVQCVTVAWYFGTLNNRVSQVEDRLKADEKENKDGIKDVNADRAIKNQLIDLRLNRMDDKLDRLLEADRVRK